MKKISFTKNPAPANRIDSLFFVRDMLRNGIPRVYPIFFPRNGIPSIFLLCGTVQNGIPRVFCSAEWFRGEFREFASTFVPWYRIPSILLLCGTVRNGIPRVLCSAEQPEFRRNKPIVTSIPSSEENFFCRKLPTLDSDVKLKFAIITP
jgi:hypothetical protein